MIKQGDALADTLGEDPVSTESPRPVEGEEAPARWQEVASLAGRVDRAAVRRLLEYLGDDDPIARWQAGLALADTAARLRRRARLGSPIWKRRSPELTFSGLLALMQQGLEHPEAERRAATADALALWDHEMAVALLIQAMADVEPLVRASAAAALGKIGDKVAVSVLVSALSDPSVWVRQAAADAMGAIAEPRAVPALEQALADPQPLVRASVVCALGHMPTCRARRMLEERARDGDGAMRWYSARGLGNIGDVGSLPALAALREDDRKLFGQSVAEVAAGARRAIDARESDFWSRLRRAFQFARSRLGRKRRASNNGGLVQSPPE